MNLAPVVLFVYNRPVHTRRTVEALLKNKEAKESDLIIYSDAPKIPEVADAVREVREYIRALSGFKSVSIVERDRNWGLANSIIDGVTSVVNERGRIIVLEDDLVVTPHFLDFMNHALDRYESEQQVMQVAGFTLSTPSDISTDAFLLPVTTTWGWATWARAWKHFSSLPVNLEAAKLDKDWRRLFDLNGTCAYSSMLEDRLEGRNDSWGILWWYAVSRRNGLVVYPVFSLVWNSGFDGSGTHCGSGDFFQQNEGSSNLETRPTVTFAFPSAVRFESAHLLQLENYFRSMAKVGKGDVGKKHKLKIMALKLKSRIINAFN